MDWEYIINHLLSGCVPMIPALVLYFIILHMIGKKQTKAHIVVSFVFCFYLLGVLTVTGICIRATFSPRFCFIPFVDMIKGPVNTVLNILMFTPLGFFLPLLYEKYDHIGKIALTAFLISLSIEIVQMFGFGATDINDLITNTVGACLGYKIYELLLSIFPKNRIEQIQVKGSQCYYELLIFWIGSLLIMLTVQVLVFHTFLATGISAAEMQVWK